jgi:hypothetical protein
LKNNCTDNRNAKIRKDDLIIAPSSAPGDSSGHAYILQLLINKGKKTGLFRLEKSAFLGHASAKTVAHPFIISENKRTV